MIIWGIVFCVVGALLIWFNIPYSSLKSNFNDESKRLKIKHFMELDDEGFKEEDFKELPDTIQKYIEHCGYLGKSKMDYMQMEYKNVAFKQGKNGKTLKIDYTQFNYVSEPTRIAFIDSGLFGIPFQGYDYYIDGTGGMKGVIAKFIKLFNQTGEDMDKACLVTYLAEAMFVPTVLMQDYIKLEESDDKSVKATITYKEQTASGVFHFNDKFEMTSFTTNDRSVVNKDGSIECVPWTAQCDEYEMSANDILQPTKFKAVWNYPEEDLVYFDGSISMIKYGK